MRAKIDLFTDSDIEYKHPWANIEYDKTSLLISMYECGELSRKLYSIDKKRAIDLANAILNITNIMDEDKNITY